MPTCMYHSIHRRNSIVRILPKTEMYREWAQPNFIIGVSKSKMEYVNQIAMITAKHSLFLKFLGSIFKFTRYVWKTAIDEECRNYSE